MSAANSAARLLPLFDEHPSFDRELEEHGASSLVRGRVRTLQVNVGKLCNMACHHCHVEAGPKRTEIMPRNVADRLIELLAKERGWDIDTIPVTVDGIIYTGNPPLPVDPHRGRL